MIERVCAAILTWPIRVGPLFGATETTTIPDALPLRPDEIVIQFESVSAVHEHPSSVVTLTDTCSPLAATLLCVWLRTNTQGAAA